ncbi:MAG: radical SAM protein [Candidatus Woesearchaeota archaeon]
MIIYSNFNHQREVEYLSLISRIPPLDLLYCREMTRPIIESHLIDANNLDLSIKGHIDAINSRRPTYVVFSCDVFSVQTAKQVIKGLQDIRIIMVGMFPTTNPDYCFKELGADLVIRGEPEEGMELIAKKGLGARGKGICQKEHTIRPHHMKDLDTLPIPARDEQYRYKNPFSENITVMKVHRGCPYQCSFCDAHNMFGKRLRSRSTQHIIKEIEYCISQGIRFIAFLDHTFTDSKKTEELCKEIIRRDLRFNWIAMSRTDRVNKRLLRIMKKAGCVMLGYGIETYEKESLAKTKQLKIKTIKKALKQTREAGILTMGYAIIGFPDDTRRTIERRGEDIMHLDLDFLQITFATPLPGTRLCSQYNIPDDFSDYRFLKVPLINNHMTRDELLGLRDQIYKIFYLNPLRGIARVNRLIKTKGVSKKQLTKTTLRLTARLFAGNSGKT